MKQSMTDKSVDYKRPIRCPGCDLHTKYLGYPCSNCQFPLTDEQVDRLIAKRRNEKEQKLLGRIIIELPEFYDEKIRKAALHLIELLNEKRKV